MIQAMVYSETAREQCDHLCSALRALDTLINLILGTAYNFIFLQSHVHPLKAIPSIGFHVTKSKTSLLLNKNCSITKIYLVA